MKNLYFLCILFSICGCQDNNIDMDTVEFVPSEVIVGIKKSATMEEIFQFINQFDHQVVNFSRTFFTSNLPLDSLDYLSNSLDEKTYTNNGLSFPSVWVRDSQIVVFTTLYQMDNLNYQSDWLNTMEVLKLRANIPYSDSTVKSNASILFRVPEGQEVEWVNQFVMFNIVAWAELNYINAFTNK